jgi:hypothetical protein
MSAIKKLTYEDETHFIDELEYASGGLAVRTATEVDGLYASISINIEGTPLSEGEFVLNHDITRNYREALLASGLFTDTGKRVTYGFVQGQPVWKLNG